LENGNGQTGTVTPRSARAHAPVRVLDAGGWTDTWFAGGGAVCNLAVGPGVHATVAVTDGEPGVIDLTVDSLGDRYHLHLPDAPGRHPLIEAALRCWAPQELALKVIVQSPVPAGSGVGTSAAVVVALIGALWALRGVAIDRGALARSAHSVETDELGLQSGVQDQLAASFGGASLLTVRQYPDAEVHPLALAAPTWDALARRLLTVYFGAPHRSSTLHEEVIARLTAGGGGGATGALADLRQAARAAADALVAGDLVAYGAALEANTEAQVRLHPALVSPAARSVMALAASHGAFGAKVNGAGGDGGSVSIVGPDDTRQLAKALVSLPGVTLLELRPDRFGLTVQSE
jgi:D-glycero-alpha-D-manno-heptose-7-phosphate kinase